MCVFELNCSSNSYITKIHQWQYFAFTMDTNTHACSQDFSVCGGMGGGVCIPQELVPQINIVRVIGYASSEDTTSD